MQLVLVDRDGVINYESSRYIKTADEWEAIPGSLEAIAKLGQAGYTIAVLSNQPAIAKGLMTYDDLNDIHAKMLHQLSKYHGAIHAFFICPHCAKDKCNCRKPKPRLIHQAAERFNASLDQVVFIGDRRIDMQAAIAAKVNAILVRTGPEREELIPEEIPSQVMIYENLKDAAYAILNPVQKLVQT